jgi:peroxiredoxin
MLTLVVGTVLPWLLVAIGVWLGYQVVRQNGRILLRLEGIETQLKRRGSNSRDPAAREQHGLPLGSAAPDFELPDLAGVRHKLSEFRGRDVLLIFFNPQCGFCTKMAVDLAALPVEGGEGQAVPIVVTTGDLSENRQLFQQCGTRCVVLLQQQMEVAHQYRAQGTPMGYRIDPEGRIASELAVGAEPLLKLADLNSTPPPAAPVKQNGSASQGMGKVPDPSLARSRLNRSGLKAGAVAPDFLLPRVGGGELSLAELRGQRVLLVFSDPKCGPCDELAPYLQELHQQRRDLAVVMISRRDAEATAAKATALGLTFPIVMQQQWEISKKYGMFATPIGYLIDEQGIVTTDVAVGIEPIRSLAGLPPLAAIPGEPSLHRKEAAWAT